MKMFSSAVLLLWLAACCPAQGQKSTTPAQQPTKNPSSETPEAPFPEGQQQLARRAAELHWRPCPMQISRDCRMAVLEGDPQKPGLFTLRFRSESPFELPVHRHPRHERVTVLEGEIHVAFGETLEKHRAQTFSRGDYYVNRAGAPHSVWTTGPVVGQVTGFGPWVVEPLNAISE